MPLPQTAAELRTRIRSRADMVNDTFVTDDELDDFIQEEMVGAYDILIESAGPDHYMDVTGADGTVAGTDTYPIYLIPAMSVPAGIYKLVRVEVTWDDVNGTPRWYPARPYQHWEAQDLAWDDGGWREGAPVYYRTFLDELEGLQVQPAASPTRSIRFMPTPQGVHYFRVWFLPFPGTPDEADTDDIIGTYGVNEYIISGVASKCLEKAELFKLADRQLARQERAADRIRRHAQTLNYDESERIRNRAAESSYGGLWPDLDGYDS